MLTSLISFVVLLGPALAADLLYRVDGRSPETIQSTGLVSKNPSGTLSLFDHVDKKDQSNDPWVSTTTSKSFAKSGAQSITDIYVYTLDKSRIPASSMKDVAEEYKKTKEKYPHPAEMEVSVKGSIPWNAVVSWDVYKRSKKVGGMTRDEFERGKRSQAPSPEPQRGSSKSPSKGSSKSPSSSPKKPRSFIA
ncbi:ADP-ribosylation [Myriangium duriaei CBS 260.36]|uniref:ADP-ribosylation n=1 Tax=Myriangium duriaei CBS 260.36 TaxID=1168546 RepID=A0A9P4J6I6_9PEZI|nr:ADP-ribosylation [Myriangium duriaei CBS 260.36]